MAWKISSFGHVRQPSGLFPSCATAAATAYFEPSPPPMGEIARVIHHGVLEALRISNFLDVMGHRGVMGGSRPRHGDNPPKYHRVKMNTGVFAGSRLHPGFAAASWLGGLEALGGAVSFACLRMPGGRLASNPELFGIVSIVSPCVDSRAKSMDLYNRNGGGRKVGALLQLYGLFRLPLRNTATRQGA